MVFQPKQAGSPANCNGPGVSAGALLLLFPLSPSLSFPARSTPGSYQKRFSPFPSGGEKEVETAKRRGEEGGSERAKGLAAPLSADVN